MINKRLIKMGDIKPVIFSFVCKLIGMILNVVFIFALAFIINEMYQGVKNPVHLLSVLCIFALVITLKIIARNLESNFSHNASCEIKVILRKEIYGKILRLGTKLKNALVVQTLTEGVEQLQTYYGSYLPQFFFCMISPIILFLIIAPINLLAAFLLFICVPLIPVSIIVIQKIAKRLLSKYWGMYAALGDDFLENVEGMTTLKINKADEHYHKEMNKSAEHFRKVTMKVLTMQLNSIIVMDTVAYGGSALGAAVALLALSAGELTVFGAVVIILLASQFFLPMRLLGSYFHIAMNGMAAADKMFSILDMEESENGKMEYNQGDNGVVFNDVSFSYEDKQVLNNISFSTTKGITAFAGKSGCGKSTLTSIITKDNINYKGSIKIGGVELSNLNKESLYHDLTFIGDKSYLFTGTVRENLLMAQENALEEDMIAALKKVRLWDFLSLQNGLDTVLKPGGSNLSGGQRQRLSLARALIRQSGIYIFDEVTSNIDVESENAIMEVIIEISKTKIVFLISHRLANLLCAKEILLIKDGVISERGNHNKLMEKKGAYYDLFTAQKELESFGRLDDEEK